MIDTILTNINKFRNILESKESYFINIDIYEQQKKSDVSESDYDDETSNDIRPPAILTTSPFNSNMQ